MHAPKSQRTSRASPHRQDAAHRNTDTADPLSPLDNSLITSATHSFTSESRPSHLGKMTDPNSTVGQFAFAPATQQTTVVTTTTTTVNLAPFLLKQPEDLHERDPKQYPLAFSHTPASMRRFGFEVGGQQATYKEAEDAGTFLEKYNQQQHALSSSNGIISQHRTQEQPQETPSRHGKQPAHRSQKSQNPLIPHARSHRSTSPPSLAEAAEIASLQRKRKKPRSLLSQLSSTVTGYLPGSNPSQHLDTSIDDETNPATPETYTGSARRLRLYSATALRGGSSSMDGQGSRARNRASNGQTEDAGSHTANGGLRLQELDTLPEAGSLAAATPPIMESDVESEIPSLPRFDLQRRMPPPALITSSQQDASLPSPSLSPVTAAANLARSRAAARDAANNDDDGSDVSGLDIDEMIASKNPSNADNHGTVKHSNSSRTYNHHGPTDQPSSSSKTLMDIPSMIKMFDALPDELQNYVMFHMLKRCSKKTLHTIAEVVNPALKCDPFDVLPVELSLKITKFLDGKSLCRASQVSKRWRHLINSDEKAWKDLIDRDGFTLPDGEIERAVREGWGWQYPGYGDFERNLPASMARRTTRPGPRPELDRNGDGGVGSDIDDSASTASARTRLKRKAASQASSSKRQKRRITASSQDGPSNWIRDLSKTQGPIAYASAAAKVVPNPNVGLPSLASLHLFKSIYQRHHMIRKSWMQEDSKPHHLAFRAHHRHVVTCLLFDSDRIITGSDDTSINVYDTKTGVLRKKLEGHEGGVWALSCDGDLLVSGSTDRSVRVWNIRTGECVQTFQGHTSTVRCLVILKPTDLGEDADGNRIIHPEEPVIITGSRDSTLRVWRLPGEDDPPLHQAGPPANERDNPYALRTLNGHHNSVRAIAAHGNTLISGSYDCTVRVWKISTGEMVHRLQGHSQKVYSVVLDHERGRCISGSMDNLVKVWSLDSGVCLFNLEGHTSLVGLLDLSDNYLVSAAADSTLRIWDPENGLCRNTLTAHTGAITCFQHDGQKVISGSDRTLKMWNVETGECVRDLLADLSGVWQVRFDERRCVAAVQRNNLTYIEVLDFGASRDGIPPTDRGRRIVVDARGNEIDDESSMSAEAGLPAV